MPKATEGSVAKRRAEPFRFLDLPAELRNEIYKLLLCTMEDHTVPLSDQMHPQILRTCQRVYHEGTWVMRRNNFFVEVICRDGFIGWPGWPLEWFNIPYLFLDERQRRSFKGVVVTHDLYAPPVFMGDSDSFIIPHRHLDRFCTALRYIEATFGYEYDGWEHMITLREPYETYGVKHNFLQKPFLSLKRQEELLEPYRRLGSLDDFFVFGNVDYYLKSRAEQEASLRRRISPEEVCDLLQSFKEESTKALSCPELAKPVEISSRVIQKTWIILKGTKWDHGSHPDPNNEWSVAIEDAEDTEKTVFDRIVRLHFEIWLDLFKITVANWQRDKRRPNRRTMCVVYNSMHLFMGYGDSKWRISSKQFAELHHQRAIAWRLIGDIDEAAIMISRALSATPNAPELLKEKSKITRLYRRERYGPLLRWLWSCFRWLLLYLTVGTVAGLVLLYLFEITLCFQTETPAMTICFPRFSLGDDIILWTNVGNHSLVLLT
jgi:hypothetical protein